MYSPTVNRTEADKTFIVVHNVEASSITTGMGVRLVGAAPAEEVSADGIQAVMIESQASMANFIGIAKKDIPSNDYGVVQTFGYVDSIMLSNVGSSLTIGTTGGIAASYLKKGGASGTFFSAQIPQNLSIAAWKYVQTWNTSGISGATWAKGFVRGI